MTIDAQPWKKRSQIPDMQVLDVAEQYHDASRILNAQGPGAGVLLPLMNAAAVSVELFLKSLSAESVFVPELMFGGHRVYASPDVKRHTLVDLFESIPIDIREELELQFATSRLQSVASSVPEILHTYEGLFSISRYPFEEGSDIRSFPLSPLMQLADFLWTFLNSLKPVDRIEW